ncbi:hypothetical protein MYP_4176 [Sporocytophaga myxococcoides]|uniref:Tetratricopeptide repeat protein n=1 Tax=Sporocytophaga myxococcoides TaxID=153721 RepID=A0A098LIY1_9BACT|nr:hypothetical protein [Sporocytophaga myxococcoides]GAL86946.1 hypothetical protein MYP_4176 [Sporocytophaga myxococcoides]
MKTKALQIISLLFFISTTVFSQDNLFTVLATKGANKYASSGSSEWKAITPGKKLLKDDKLSIDENGYIGLVHKSGKTIEIKKAGVYEVAKLNGEVAAQNSSITKKYVDYVTSEISNGGSENMASNRHKYMDVTGSVERDVPAIKVLAPKESFVIGLPVLLKWKPVAGAKSYAVTVKNLFDEPVYSIEVENNFVILDFSKLNIQKDKVYGYQIETKGAERFAKFEGYSFKYLPEDKAAKVSKEADELKANLNEETALNKIILATFYEDQNLLLNALECYETALKLSPDIEEYKIAYGKFLNRNKLAEK